MIDLKSAFGRVRDSYGTTILVITFCEEGVLVLFPDGLVDTGKSPPTPDSRLRGNNGQVKRVSGIRHIQVEAVLVS